MHSNENIQLLYIDLFCGAGGTSTGVENAVVNGKKIAKVIACVNHDKNAIASHKANHPEAIHYTEDIRTLDLGPMTKHIALARRTYPQAKVVLWASLECTNFSRAKGGMSRDADFYEFVLRRIGWSFNNLWFYFFGKKWEHSYLDLWQQKYAHRSGVREHWKKWRHFRRLAYIRILKEARKEIHAKHNRYDTIRHARPANLP